MTDEKKVLAERSLAPGITFVGFLLSGIVMIAIGLIFGKLIWVFGIILTPISGYFVADYFKTPRVLLKALDKKYIELHNGEKISCAKILNVTSNPYTMTGGKRNWGSVIITTSTRKTKLKYVDGCETVVKNILDIL